MQVFFTKNKNNRTVQVAFVRVAEVLVCFKA